MQHRPVFSSIQHGYSNLAIEHHHIENWLVVSTILKNISQLGRIIPYIMDKNKKCSKPPTRLATGHQEINNFPAIFDYQIGILDFIESLSVGIFVTWMVSGHKLPCWSADSINKVGWKKTRPATGTLNVIPRLLTFHVFPLILSLPPNNSEVSLVVFSPRILFSVAQQSLPLLENTSKKKTGLLASCRECDSMRFYWD